MGIFIIVCITGIRYLVFYQINVPGHRITARCEFQNIEICSVRQFPITFSDIIPNIRYPIPVILVWGCFINKAPITVKYFKLIIRIIFQSSYNQFIIKLGIGCQTTWNSDFTIIKFIFNIEMLTS